MAATPLPRSRHASECGRAEGEAVAELEQERLQARQEGVLKVALVRRAR